MRITSAKISIEKDSVGQIDFSIKKRKYFINISDDSVVSDFLDLNFIKRLFEEEAIEGEKSRLYFDKPLIITYKGKPLAEIYPDGRKKLHSLTGIHLGLRLLIHRIVSEI